MAAPIIPTLPPAPQPTDSPEEFDEKAYPFVDALNAFGEAINEFGEFIGTDIDVVKTIRMPESVPALPNAAARADKFLTFNPSGDPLLFSHADALVVLAFASDDAQPAANYLLINGIEADPSLVRSALNVADGATANATNAQLRDRATHTGVQPISSVSNLQSSLDSKVDDSQIKSNLSSPNATDIPNTLAVASALSAVSSGVNPKGNWNAATNTPALASSVGTNGDSYDVVVAGNTTLDGYTDWEVGDKATFASGSWNKVPGSAVKSIDGRTGAVILNYETPAQAALASLPVGAKYSTKGSVTVGDGGGSDFIVESASGASNIYRRTLLANGNHGVLQPVNGFVRPEQYGIFTGSNLASLRLVNPPADGALFKMDSRLAGQNVDGGIYYWNASSTIPDDNKNVIAVTGVATGRWLKQTGKITNRDPIGNVAPRLRGSIADGFGGDSIAVIGDSISHGANVADIHNDSYVGIFRKLANLEFGATNTGFVPINWQIANSEGTYSEIHSVASTGSWTSLTLADASASICGFIRRSSTAGAKLTITVPTIARHFKVLYQGGTGGVFEISKDGGSTVTATITSTGSSETLKTAQYTLVDLGLGSSEITLTVVSGQVDIVGIEYEDEQSNFAVNNYSQSGRKIEFIDDAVITKACLSNRMLVWSLGFNDSGLAAGASRDTVLAKLDFLAAQAKANFTKLVICDFIWGQEQNHWLRSKFREVVQQVEGAVYIPFPDLFYRGGFIISASTLNSTYNFTNDNTHPTVTGHKLIAETLARALGFTFATKKAAEMFDPIWRPIALINGWVNTFTSSVYVTAYRRHGNSVQVRIAVNKTGATSGVIGNLPSTINIPLRSYIPVADSASAIFIVDLNIGLSSSITLKDYAGLAGVNVSAQIAHSINNNFDFSRFD